MNVNCKMMTKMTKNEKEIFCIIVGELQEVLSAEYTGDSEDYSWDEILRKDAHGRYFATLTKRDITRTLYPVKCDKCKRISVFEGDSDLDDCKCGIGLLAW